MADEKHDETTEAGGHNRWLLIVPGLAFLVWAIIDAIVD